MDTLFEVNSSLFSTVIDNETALLDESCGHYYLLDPVASDIYHLLKNPCTLEQLTAQLCQIYQVQAKLCQQDIIPFLQKLVQHNIVLTR